MRKLAIMAGLVLSMTAATAAPTPAISGSRMLTCGATSRAQVAAELRDLRVVAHTGDLATAEKVLGTSGVTVVGALPLRIELMENHLNDGEMIENSYHFTTSLAAKLETVKAGMAAIPGATCQSTNFAYVCTFVGPVPKYMSLNKSKPGRLSLKCTYMFD